MHTKAFGAALAVLLIATHARGAETTAAPKVGALLDNESRVYVGECMLAHPGPAKPDAEKTVPAVAVAALATKLVDVVADLVVGVAKSAAADQTISVDTAMPAVAPLYEADGQGKLWLKQKRCIQVITGDFESTPVTGEPSDATTTLSRANANVAKVDKTLKEPRIVFEAAIVALNSSVSSFALQPRLFYYGGPSKKKFFESSDKVKRNVALNLSMKVNSTAEGKALGNMALHLRDVKPGTLLGPDYFGNRTFQPLPMPSVETADLARLNAAKAQLQAIDAAQKKLKGPPLRDVKADEPLETAARPGVQPPPLRDVRADESYQKALKDYCDEWKKYVDAAKTDFKAALPKGKTADDFEPPKTELCPLDVRVALINAEVKKSQLEATVSRLADEKALTELKANAGEDIVCSDKGCTLIKQFPMDFQPMTVSANVVEMREASAFAKHLADVAEKIKPEAVNVIKAKLPSSKDAAEEEAASAEATKVENAKQKKEDFELAKAKAEDAYATWQNADADKKNAEWLKVLDHRIKANRAARQAKVDEPYVI